MSDLVGAWPFSGWEGFFRHMKTLLLGCRREDGSIYMSRGEYATWLWKAHFWKWLKAPLRCKQGTHRIGYKSDTGMGCGCAKGMMDVWCLDCDHAVLVPIDDALEARGGARVLGIWNDIKDAKGCSQ